MAVGRNRSGSMGCSMLLAAALLMLLGGCESADRKAMKAAAEALRQDDYDQATILANEALDNSPKPDVAAEAYYIRGRAAEQSPATSRAQLQANLQRARSSYIEALRNNPPKKLQTYIRVSLGKVAFFQDDFATAAQQLAAAYPQLDDKDLKGGALYYLAKSQQRGGQFVVADSLMATVMKEFEGSEWARRAADTRGARAFYVQLAIYKIQASAELAIKALRQRSLTPLLMRDAQQRLLLRLGPFATYAQARDMRDKVALLFTDAMVIP